MTAPPDRTSRMLAWALAAALAIGFAWYARATYWQCDDAYISYRYVWNLVHGHGLVFNGAGERVEGYTNFAWVLELALVWKVFGLSPETGSIVLSVVATIGALGCVWFLARTGPWPERRVLVGFGALLLLCTSRTWAAWTTSGLETRQFTLFVLLGVLALASAKGRARRLVAASLAFAAAELTRPEALLLWACAGAWLVLEMLLERRWSWKLVCAFVLPCAAVIGAHYLWRHAYYGDWLPNTYYAKYVRPWPEAGLTYLAAALIESGAWLLIPLAVAGGIARAQRGDRTHVLTAMLLVPHAVYLARIGGDAFEMRPFDLWWPLLAPAAVEGICALAALIAQITRRRIARPVGAVVMLLVLAYGSAVQVAKAHVTMRHDTRATSIKLRGNIEPDDAPWIRLLPGMSSLLADFNALREENAPRLVGTLWRVQEVLWRDELASWQPYALARNRPPLPPDAVFARISVGVVGWCLPDLTIIDLVGLTDRVVAHTPCTRPNSQRILAHDRAADPAYLKQRGLNMNVRPAARSRDEALGIAAFALRCDEGVWMPFDSPDPSWVARAFQGHEAWTWTTQRCIGCFDQGLAGWTLSGPAFDDNPRTGLPFSKSFQWPRRSPGDVGLGTQDARHGGRGRGVARSSAFVAQSGQRFEARLAATSIQQCGVRLVDGEEVVKMLTSDQPGMLLPQQVDLSPWAGRTLRVEVFDDSDEDWIIVADAVVIAPGRVE